MSAFMRLFLALVVVGILGVIGITLFVGSRVREETVVARPYEEGLRQDAERASRAALGWHVRLPDERDIGEKGTVHFAVPGPAPLPFELLDGAGRPVEGAEVRLTFTLPETSRAPRSFEARALGGGRYVAEVDYPPPAEWSVRFDVRRGPDRVQVERTVAVVRPDACDPGAARCTAPLDRGGTVALELGPRPLRTMRELTVRAVPGGVPAGAAVTVSLSMDGMEMGRNEVRLAEASPGRYEGKAVLVRCPSGRQDWTARVTVAPPGEPPRTTRFHLRVVE